MEATHHALTLALTTAALICTSCAEPLDRIEEVEITETVGHLRVVNESGDVRLVASDRDTVAFIAEIYGEETRVEHVLTGTTLSIGVDLPYWCSGCAVDFTIEVPSNVTAAIENGSGDVRLTALRASASVDTGSGDVAVVDFAASKLTLETGSGSIHGEGLCADQVHVSTGSGNVRLGFEAFPEDVQADTGSGDQSIEVPRGAYHVEWHTGSGDLEANGITLDKTAPVMLRLESGSGDIVVIGR